MRKCFAVLWIPTIHHTRPPFENPLNDGELTADISDIYGTPLHVKLRADGKNIDIYTAATTHARDFELFISLEYEDFSHNGLVKYSFEPRFLDETKYGFGFDGNNFTSVVYHMIKGFYHEHDFHEDEADSSLPAFVSDEDVEIHNFDNAPIEHYLKNYSKTISNIAKYAKDFMRRVVDIEKNTPDKAIEDFDAFLKLYVMGMGYDSYLRSLYASVYNRKFRLSSESNESNILSRRYAFNIENSIRYLKVLYAFYDTKMRNNNAIANLNKIGDAISLSESNIKETTRAATCSTKWAIAGILFSILFGIGSIGYSIKLSRESSAELQELRVTLEKTIEGATEKNQQKLDSLIMQASEQQITTPKIITTSQKTSAQSPLRHRLRQEADASLE